MKTYLAIDVGGTAIKSALVNIHDMTLREQKKFPTPTNKEDFLHLLQKIIETHNKDVEGIGMGLPGMIDMAQGILLHAEHLSFLNNWNMRNFFEAFKVPVKFDNDSRCFLRGEWITGAAKGYNNVLGVAIGTGIGGGLIINGKIYNGAHGSAGEFGHMQIEKNATFESLGAKAAYEQYGDRSEVIGAGIANLINAFDPEIVVLGGGGVFKGGIHLEVIQKTAAMLVKSPPAKKTPIVKGVYGEWAQLLGAAMLFQDN